MMADQHAEGVVSTVKGSVNEAVGKLTGDRTQEAKGKVQKVQGKAQDSLGDVQGRGRWQPIMVSVMGAAIVVVVVRLLTGWLRTERSPS